MIDVLAVHLFTNDFITVLIVLIPDFFHNHRWIRIPFRLPELKPNLNRVRACPLPNCRYNYCVSRKSCLFVCVEYGMRIGQGFLDLKYLAFGFFYLGSVCVNSAGFKK